MLVLSAWNGNSWVLFNFWYTKVNEPPTQNSIHLLVHKILTQTDLPEGNQDKSVCLFSLEILKLRSCGWFRGNDFRWTSEFYWVIQQTEIVDHTGSLSLQDRQHGLSASACKEICQDLKGYSTHPSWAVVVARRQTWIEKTNMTKKILVCICIYLITDTVHICIRILIRI